MSSCNLNDSFIKCLSEMTDTQILNYCENYSGMEGRELVNELANRVRSKNCEIYHLTGKLDNVVKRHTSE